MTIPAQTPDPWWTEAGREVEISITSTPHGRLASGLQYQGPGTVTRIGVSHL